MTFFRIRIGLLLSATLLSGAAGLAQVDVDQSLTPAQYVNDVLLGEGVSATNIQFTGSLDQIGYMTGGGGEFPHRRWFGSEFGQCC